MTESHNDLPDEWYLTLFAAKSMELIYSPHFNDSRQALQPFLVGNTICISNRVSLAWCRRDAIECPWKESVLIRRGPGIDEIRHAAALMMQYSLKVPASRYQPIATVINVQPDDRAIVFAESYDTDQLRILIEGNCEVAPGRYQINDHSGEALFFRWGDAGGGCVLPLAKDAG